jgi:hypothetical protein
MALEFFKLGEERFGLVVASKGEGEETRYGYEVQPIQEYFAAAYISNQMREGAAHDTFENMLRRPYWREVALFLAGLRRPNEKADLILRARNVDSDKRMGWRQDGRAVVFQLLQEGVFSEPPYVYFQALEFVLELLDVKKHKVQKEPPGLLEGLEMLMNGHAAEQHKEKMLGLLKEYGDSTDSYALKRLYRIAAKTLTVDEYFRVALSYRGGKPDLAALIRLGWPYNRDVDFAIVSREHRFWKGVSNDIWARTWWNEATISGVARELSAPASVHQHLFEEFAARGFSPVYLSRRRVFFETPSKLAVWKLYRNQQIMLTAGISRGTNERFRKTLIAEVLPTCKNDETVDYTGIENDVLATAKDLIELSNELIAASCVENFDRLRQAAERYIEGLRHHLQAPGLASWVACQCAVSFITSWLGSPERRAVPRIVKDRAFRSLVDQVRPFYVEGAGGSHRRGRKASFSDFIKRRPYGMRHGAVPALKSIRLRESDDPVPLVNIVMENIGREREFPLRWMARMTFSREILHDLVEKCQSSQLEALLRTVGQRRIVGFSERSLRVQDTQRVLKVARHTDDHIVLAGAAAVLSNASFLRVAEKDLVLKILRADSDTNIATSLFMNPRLELAVSEATTKDITLTEGIASSIINMADDYSFRTICAATQFITQFFPLKFPPLVQSS